MLEGIEERIRALEGKLSESATIESSQVMQAEKLQSKLNAWVDTIEKQVKHMEQKLTKKITRIETT